MTLRGNTVTRDPFARVGVPLLLLGFVAMSLTRASGGEKQGVNWPTFRGARAAGIAEGFKTPTQWDVEKNQNVKWKTPVPGLGHSSPAVWGNRVYVTTAVRLEGEATLKPGLYGNGDPVPDEREHRWFVYCFDKANGKELWSRLACEGVPKVKRHPKSSHANPTPATDGKRVVAFFGSEGLYCYDVNGDLLWKKDLGVLDCGWFQSRAIQWGFASSPIIHDGRVIVQCDTQDACFIAAFDVGTGNQIWRTPREEYSTWSTPTVDARPERAQVIVNGYKHIGGYDLKTGEALWRLRGGGDVPAPTPVVSRDLIFITNAHGGPSPIYAIRADATGDVTPEEGKSTSTYVAWSYQKGGNYMQTPIVIGDYIYLCNDHGTLSCLEAKTGKSVYRERLEVRAGYSASPVAADGKIYLTAETGDVFVVKAAPKFAVVARNALGETCLATPAISEGRLFFRARHHLMCIGE